MFDKKQQEKCRGCSAYYLNNDQFFIEGVMNLTYIFPMLKDIENRTREEEFLLSEMIETVNKDIIEDNIKIYEKIYDKYDRAEFSELVRGIPVIERFGDKVPANVLSNKINVVNNERYTTDAPNRYENTIYIYGKSEVLGHGVEDSDTIASQLQRMINDKYCDKYKVVNRGVSSVSDIEIENKIKNEYLKKGDIVINILLKRRCFDNENKGCAFCCEYKELYPQFNSIKNRKNMFLDSVPHLNYRGNEVIAKYIFNDIVDKVDDKGRDYGTIINKIPLYSDFNDDELGKYLLYLNNYRLSGKEHKRIGSIVMNCNPFTLGHRYLIETAAGQVDYLYIFVVEEDKSVFPFADRLRLVKQGTEDITNVCVLPSGQFMISSLTFPEYFTKEKDKDVVVDASMDLDIFGRYITKSLNITVRFVGEEPLDIVTRQYNMAMEERLPKYGVEFVEIPRKKICDNVISATKVRECIKKGKIDELQQLVPECTYKYINNNLESLMLKIDSNH